MQQIQRKKQSFCSSIGKLCLALVFSFAILASTAFAQTTDGKIAYTVKKGDTLKSIAATYFTDADLIAAMNNLPENSPLYIGDTLYLPQDPEMEVVVTSGDNIWNLAAKYHTTAENLINYNKLEQPEQLKPGETIDIPVINYQEEPQSITVQTLAARGQNLQRKLAVAATTTVKAKNLPSSQSQKTDWLTPVQGVISSSFGQRNQGYHHGVDIAAEAGTNIKAAAGGKVILAGWKNWVYGNTVTIDHGNGWQTMYAHTSKVLVEEGDTVAAGDVIALVGSTGNSTGPHLHLELRKNGTIVNPQKYISLGQ